MLQGRKGASEMEVKQGRLVGPPTVNQMVREGERQVPSSPFGSRRGSAEDEVVLLNFWMKLVEGGPAPSAKERVSKHRESRTE